MELSRGFATGVVSSRQSIAFVTGPSNRSWLQSGSTIVSHEVALGGTFDPIHDGHRALFERAFEREDVTVGLTSDSLAQETRQTERHVRPFETRRCNLRTELTEYDNGRAFEIRRLNEPTGIATKPQFDALIVSPETKPGAKRINEIRLERGHEPLDIDVVPHVRAEDGGIISSTRIVTGEIDEFGTVSSQSTGSISSTR